MEYVLMLADIIKAKDIGASKSKYYYRSASHKYEKGAACAPLSTRSMNWYSMCCL